MPSAPSYEVVDYSLRPNKNIERKLMLELLQALSSVLAVPALRYVGFGGVWFVDFVLFHKALRIRDMVSIERDGAERAKFNRPFACIDVVEGESSQVLQDLEFDRKKSLVWLDFDSSINGPAFADASYLAETAVEGSVIFISLNSDVRVLKQLAAADPSKEPDREATLRRFAGEAVPASPPTRSLTRQDDYDKLLAEVLIRSMARAARRSGRTERFYPIANMAYKDRSPMLTVGGVLLSPTRSNLLNNAGLKGLPWYSPDGKKQYRISAPLLTAREKVAIDTLLPAANGLDADRLYEQTSLKLKPEHVAEYVKVYRHYPQFSELIR